MPGSLLARALRTAILRRRATQPWFSRTLWASHRKQRYFFDIKLDASGFVKPRKKERQTENGLDGQAALSEREGRLCQGPLTPADLSVF
jgi:hypothetical protein